MSNNFNNFLSEDVLDRYFGSVETYLIPDKLYVGLTTEPIDDTDTGTTVEADEPDGADGYLRVEIDNNKTTWTEAEQVTTHAEVENDIEIIFQTATGSWGEVQYFFIADDSTGGNILVQGELDTAKTVDNGDTAQFGTGDIKIRLN